MCEFICGGNGSPGLIKFLHRHEKVTTGIVMGVIALVAWAIFSGMAILGVVCEPDVLCVLKWVVALLDPIKHFIPIVLIAGTIAGFPVCLFIYVKCLEITDTLKDEFDGDSINEETLYVDYRGEDLNVTIHVPQKITEFTPDEVRPYDSDLVLRTVQSNTQNLVDKIFIYKSKSHWDDYDFYIVYWAEGTNEASWSDHDFPQFVTFIQEHFAERTILTDIKHLGKALSLSQDL